jgi:hypothetical protein
MHERRCINDFIRVHAGDRASCHIANDIATSSVDSDQLAETIEHFRAILW